MPDYVISITNEEVQVLESFYPTAEQGILNSARRHIKSLARAVIEESTSKMDPDKLTNQELRAEIQGAQSRGEILTHAERYPTIGE